MSVRTTGRTAWTASGSQVRDQTTPRPEAGSWPAGMW